MFDATIDGGMVLKARELNERSKVLERLVSARLVDAASDPGTEGIADVARDIRDLSERLLKKLDSHLDPIVRPVRPRVLVVDDCQDTLEILETALSASGWDVITATNGVEALVAAHTERPAAIVMDITMPVLDGLETARLLRSVPATRRVPVVAHTANPEICTAQGRSLFAEVVAKPSTPDVLIAVLRHVTGS
jgi:CheY-like chemotaxis protein